MLAKKIALTAFAGTALLASTAFAHDGGWNRGYSHWHGHGYGYGRYYGPRVVVMPPAPVYYTPAPVVYPQPVYAPVAPVVGGTHQPIHNIGTGTSAARMSNDATRAWTPPASARPRPAHAPVAAAPARDIVRSTSACVSSRRADALTTSVLRSGR